MIGIDKYAIWGCGNACKEVFELDFFDMDSIVAFVDSDPQKQGRSFHGHCIISPEELGNFEFDSVIITIRNPEIIQQIKNKYDFKFISLTEYLLRSIEPLLVMLDTDAAKGNEELLMRFWHRVLGKFGVLPVAIPDSIYHFDFFKEYEALKKLYCERNTLNQLKDISRLQSLMFNINKIIQDGVKGAFAEVGVYLGNNCAVLHEYCRKFNRKLYMFDTFEGFDEQDLVGVDETQRVQFEDTSLESVKQFVGDDSNTIYIRGYFPESITEESRKEQYAFVSIDCDLYKPIKAALEFFYPRLAGGGMIFIHDYLDFFYEGAKKAVDEYCVTNGLQIVLLADKAGTAVITKGV